MVRSACLITAVLCQQSTCEQAPSEVGKKNSASESERRESAIEVSGTRGCLRTPSLRPLSARPTLRLDYTRLSRPKPNQEPVRRLPTKLLNLSSLLKHKEKRHDMTSRPIQETFYTDSRSTSLGVTEAVTVSPTQGMVMFA